jgi:hypothetical protein
MSRIGMMEYWNTGIMGSRTGALTIFHHSIIPPFQDSFGERYEA